MRQLVVAIVVALTVSACAPKTPPVVPSGAPRYPDFIFPAAAAASSEPVRTRQQHAWQLLQAGDLRGAEREFQVLLQASSDFYFAETGLGYVALARKDLKTALTHFDRAIAIQKGYAPAHAGRGQTLLATQQPEAALASFDAALAADPSLPGIRSVADVLRFKGLQGDVASARQAAEAGRLAEARDAYAKAIAATPDSPFLYRELAMVERRDNMLDAALAHIQKALTLDPNEPRNHVVLADVLEAQGKFGEAADAIALAVVLEPNEALGRRLDALRERAAFDALPEEYRSIESAETITRAQLAALIGNQLEDMVKSAPARSTAVMSDVRGNWAQPWILSVTRAGFMEPFLNHTFQPNATVNRGDLAFVVSRVLNVIAARRPPLASEWRNARPKFSDVPPGHLRYPLVSLAVAAGVMAPTPDGAFQISRPVSGAEAISAVRKLQELAGSTRR
jgi:tetratricopeptide (TPR) repeat protein